MNVKIMRPMLLVYQYGVSESRHLLSPQTFGCQGKLLFPQGQYLGTDHSGRDVSINEAHGNPGIL